MFHLIGTQQDAELTEDWKGIVWRCPKCKFWFTEDWNHDGLACCACACCAYHPVLHKKDGECDCKKCVYDRDTENGKYDLRRRPISSTDASASS